MHIHFLRIHIYLALAAAIVSPQSFSAESCAPDNLGEHKSALTAYKTSGQYDADLTSVATQAKQYLQERLGKVDKPTIVLDVDETALSNYPALKINDYGFIIGGACDLEKGPCGFLAWIDMAKGTAIAPSLELYRFARENNVAIFFITGRPAPTHARGDGEKLA